MKEINKTTWKVEDIVDNDSFEVEIGDVKQKDFFPQVKIKRWDNECNFSVRRIEFRKGKVLKEKKVIKEIHSNIEDHFYQKENGFEFETLLKEKPQSNVLEYRINTKNLDFFYQPKLTQQEIEEGCQRPENVVGSYAVYHSSKKNNQFKNGKAFHIYRPKIIDAKNKQVWGKLNIKDSILTVTIPQKFINKATYPVVVDPTFGHTTLGATLSIVYFYGPYRSEYTMNAENGTVTKLTVGIKSAGSEGTNNAKAAIYSGNNVISNGVTDEVLTTFYTSSSWQDYTFTTDPSVSASTNYYLAYAAANDGTPNIAGFMYDTTTGTHSYDTTTYASVFPDPFSADGSGTRNYSIYATYTASGGAPRRIFNVS